MMKDSKQVYALYNTAYSTYSIPDEYLLLYEKACQFANGQPANLDQFDHYTFIKDYINPLFALNQKLIQDYHVRSKSYMDYTLNNQCLTIFDKSLYKGQQSKGVYFPVENENSLDEIKKTGKPVPQELLNQLNNPSIENKNIIKLVTSDFVNLPLLGKEGLKARTGLLDFKYDKR